MEIQTPQPCPGTGTARRNPRRKVRDSIDHEPETSNCTFPTEDVLSMDISQTSQQDPCKSSVDVEVPENLKIFLRLRPLGLRQFPTTKDNGFHKRFSRCKNTWPQTRPKDAAKEKGKPKKADTCIKVNDSRSVTLTPPQAMHDLKRTKSEVFGGFSYVFPPESSQDNVYAKMVSSLVEDFLRGRSGMLAAMGPSGSGKTHTVFGSPKEPGMVPLALRKIFEQRSEESGSKPSRLLYMSMFEIHSEGGKAERLLDLSTGGADISMQNTAIKGLQEVTVSELAQAESFVAQGLLKRATTSTHINSQSSRSHCIINIQHSCADSVGEVHQNNAVLTIVDLAGSEKERRTGHQSLLEHQRNPKKPLQKHFKNSLLTRYIKDYLEGKKRMTLILTIKAGEEDYLDTSFLLRQASPYMKIKFVNADEQQSNLLSNKRNAQIVLRNEQSKRIKLSEVDTLQDEENRAANSDQSYNEGIAEHFAGAEHQQSLLQPPEMNNLNIINDAVGDMVCTNCKERERSGQIMVKMSTALWNVLKQYKEKLKIAEDDAHSLRESLKKEKQQYKEKLKTAEDDAHSLRESLNKEKQQYIELEKELREVKGRMPNQDAGGENEVQKPKRRLLPASSMLVRGIDDLEDENEKPKGMKGEKKGRMPNHDNAGGESELQKPKRRLLPASSILVRGIDDLEDENKKPKGMKGEKKGASDVRRTRGSVSLLQLLSTHRQL